MRKNIITLFLFSFLSQILFSCGGSDEEDNVTPESFNIWSGSKITFSKAAGTDPSDEANQDRITENVWLTRGNDGGQIFNIKVESGSSKDLSPSGTEWAIGTTSEISSLEFKPFREAVNKPQAIGRNLVLHLITEDVYIDVRFTSWDKGKIGGGGFAYTRSTP